MEHYEETAYQELAPLDSRTEHRTWLAMNRASKRLFVRKEVERENYELAKRIMGIRNEHLAQIDHVYEADGAYFVLEDYIGGRTLEELLEEKGSLPVEESREYALQILDGLEALHGCGIVHRDVTPANIMISVDRVVKLIDFGISRTQTEGKQRDTTILGTEGYAAPEQFGFRQTDARSDLYAVGVLLNQMLTGERPGIRQTEHRRLRKVITKATSLDPKDRYADASQMRRALNGGISLNGKRDMPGFRSGTTWKKIVASVVYAGCSICFLMYFLDAVWITQKNMLREIVSAALVFVALPLLAGNIGYWDSAPPVLDKLPVWLRLLIRIAVSVAVLIVGMELYVGVSGRYQ